MTFFLRFGLPLLQFFGLVLLITLAPQVLGLSPIGVGAVLLLDIAGATLIVLALRVAVPKWVVKSETDDTATMLVETPAGLLLFAGTEDVVFVAPLLFLHGPMLYVGMAISSFVFVWAHRAYDPLSRWPKVIYPVFYYFCAKEYGLLTTIVAHGFKDFLVGCVVLPLMYRLSKLKEPVQLALALTR